MWKARLRSVYTNEEEWLAYNDIYGLAERLGYSDPHRAWKDNPRVQGSTNPKDYRVVKRGKQRTRKS